VLFRLSKTAVVVALSLSIGLHWALLQTVAWTGMVLNYSQTAPLTEALAKTFDGKHPCNLCKLVDAGKKSEKKQEAQKPASKLEVFLAANQAVLFPPRFVQPSSVASHTVMARFLTPPTPPPRQA
jgi:hypothetical protein